jgi:hypothetical protein
MTDLTLMYLAFLVFATATSFYFGRKQGINHALDFLEFEGVLEWEDE